MFEKIISAITQPEFRKIREYLESLEENTTSPYEIATTILSMAGNRSLPGVLISFLEEQFLKSIEDGNSDAINDLGALYYDGSNGFGQSFDKAVHFYKMAAAAGNRQAQENLGYCYYYGRDGEPDYEKAFHYFALGAFDGHLISLYKIGDMYRNGLYVTKNDTEAFFIYMRCIETMTDAAEGRVAGPVYLRLGEMFLEGSGVEQNLKNALLSFQRAELYLHDMVKNGNAMYRKSLEKAVEGQEKTRALLFKELPDASWEYDQ